MNKVILMGNVGKIETKQIPTGTVANISLATKMKEGSEWHNLVAFGKTADLASQYVQKGSQLLVEGYLRTRSWEAQDGKKYRTEIVIDRMEFIGKKVDREEPEDLPF